MAYKTCPDCGSRIFEYGCTHCNEQDYIDMAGIYDEPNTCAFCGKPTRFPDDRFCNSLCELDYNEPNKPKGKAQVIRMDIAPNGDLYVVE